MIGFIEQLAHLEGGNVAIYKCWHCNETGKSEYAGEQLDNVLCEICQGEKTFTAIADSVDTRCEYCKLLTCSTMPYCCIFHMEYSTLQKEVRALNTRIEAIARAAQPLRRIYYDTMRDHTRPKTEHLLAWIVGYIQRLSEQKDATGAAARPS